MVKCGIVQARSISKMEENMKMLESYAARAEAEGCSILCFPEAFLTGYIPKEAKKLAVSVESVYVKQVAELAQTYQMDLLVGFMERSHKQERGTEKKEKQRTDYTQDGEQNIFYLTHGIFRADGSRDFYRKTHLGQREQEVFTEGDNLQVFEMSCGLKVGIQLCVETHFPDITQTLSLKGAEVVFAPHAVPRVAGSRSTIWSKIVPARSYDNRVYMACCNQWDEKKFGGGCLVTDPMGEAVVSCYEEREALICFEVERKKVSGYREGNDSMKKRYYPGMRRAELYR